ncbi:MAG: hypothetical protein ACI9UN_002691 [Granulosicoccus sp.]|jgi:hypothetical protein
MRTRLDPQHLLPLKGCFWGVQIIDKPRGKASLMGAARRFEQAVGISMRLPLTPRTGG